MTNLVSTLALTLLDFLYEVTFTYVLPLLMFLIFFYELSLSIYHESMLRYHPPADNIFEWSAHDLDDINNNDFYLFI